MKLSGRKSKLCSRAKRSGAGDLLISLDEALSIADQHAPPGKGVLVLGVIPIDDVPLTAAERLLFAEQQAKICEALSTLAAAVRSRSPLGEPPLPGTLINLLSREKRR